MSRVNSCISLMNAALLSPNINESLVSENVDKEALAKIRVAHSTLANKLPFFSTLLFQLKIKSRDG